MRAEALIRFRRTSVARNRLRYRNHGSRSGAGAPAGRDRLRRAVQPVPDRPHLSQIRQSRARHAGRGLQCARAVARLPESSMGCSRRSPTSFWISSPTRRWSRITAISISPSSIRELDLAKRTPFARDRIIDTLMLARRKHPGVSNKLDDLCLRYKIDNSKRTKHGALLDAELAGRGLYRADRCTADLAGSGRGGDTHDRPWRQWRNRPGPARAAAAAHHR